MLLSQHIHQVDPSYITSKQAHQTVSHITEGKRKVEKRKIRREGGRKREGEGEGEGEEREV